MKVLLPDHDIILEDGSAEVNDGILYIYRPGAFKEIMYRLTYEIFGKKECFFCHRRFIEVGEKPEGDDCLFVTQTTLDHLIPQEFGGPTITNNMRPSCSHCNNSKGNFYPDEFQEYRSVNFAEGKRRIFLNGVATSPKVTIRVTWRKGDKKTCKEDGGLLDFDYLCAVIAT